MFTDFGLRGPYMGQMEAVLADLAPAVRVVHLMSDAPRFNAKTSAYLLASLTAPFPAGTVFMCVVDPGVGTARRALILRADGRWFVGPDNGLLAIVARHASEVEWHEILWRPQKLSASFHGRDLFAPVAAMLATRQMPDAALCEPAIGREWPDDLAEVIYVDHYGNLFTGLRANGLPDGAGIGIGIGARRLVQGLTFADAEPGELLWYPNSQGLVEIAANQGDAAALLGVGVGSALTVTRTE